MTSTHRDIFTAHGLPVRLVTAIEPLAPVADDAMAEIAASEGIDIESLRRIEVAIRERLQAQQIADSKRAPKPWHDLSPEASDRLENGEGTYEDQRNAVGLLMHAQIYSDIYDEMGDVIVSELELHDSCGNVLAGTLPHSVLDSFIVMFEHWKKTLPHAEPEQATGVFPTEYCDSCNAALEDGQIGKCDECQPS
jgi:hypothetical protein